MSQNHLVDQTSPYLLQHVDNPVDWYPWGEQALTRAATENKPILLSIGYSACHWCHVMAHESFADESTAKLMNEFFVNIKVDREERPDIDKIYQTAQFLLTQRNGGWPLTMFLTPHDHVPFFGGTYFPDKARHGLPAFKDLLLHIANTYRQKAQDIDKQNQSLLSVLSNIYQSKQISSPLEENILSSAKNDLLKAFDMQHGGFGKAPKFPHSSNLELLLRDWHRDLGTDGQNSLQATLLTLNKMAAGGLFDHVSGGFYRYSVDDYWMIPHFEKMLYDNGPLLQLYSEAYAATQESRFENCAIETADWIIRDMQSAEGGYYSSIDADSEGVEGKFYTWEKQQLESILNQEELGLVTQRFGISRSPNFEDKYHLHEFLSLSEYAQQVDANLDNCQQVWRSARKKLYAHRITRVPPGIDEKILISWNALTIKAMLIASRRFKRQDYFDSASRAIEFIKCKMYSQGRLFASYKDNKAHLNAYLDDYAFLLDALLEYLQTYWNSEYLSLAISLADVLLDQFEDKKYGGFYFTSADHETLIQRPKVFSDEATPAGNAIAACSLLRLGFLLGNNNYLTAAERCLENASQYINNTPMAHASLLRCYEELTQPLEIIIIRGNEEIITQWQEACQVGFHPGRMVFAIPDSISSLPTTLDIKRADDKQCVAYICRGSQCLAPVETLAVLTHELDTKQ